MKLGIEINGVDKLRKAMAAVAEDVRDNKMLRKGMGDAGRIISRAQKNMAPVRRNRNQKKFRSIGKVKTSAGYVRPDGPLRLIKPGLLKRSIGYRVRKKHGVWQVVMGANAGKKRRSPNFAPHRAIVGSGTRERFINGKVTGSEYGPKRGASRGIMPPNSYIQTALNFAAPAAIRALEKGAESELRAKLRTVGAS